MSQPLFLSFLVVVFFLFAMIYGSEDSFLVFEGFYEIDTMLPLLLFLSLHSLASSVSPYFVVLSIPSSQNDQPHIIILSLLVDNCLIRILLGIV